MTRKSGICRTLFSSMLTLSAFTFGGGYVIIPLVRRKFVEKLHWLEEPEMLDMMAIAQSSPGAVTVNVAVQLGRRLAGLPGAIAAVVGTLLPPLVLLAIISVCYDAFRASPVVSAFLKSMQAGVSAVVAVAMLSMGKAILKKRRALDIGLLAAALLAAFLLKWNAILILLACGATGAICSLVRGRKADGA